MYNKRFAFIIPQTAEKEKGNLHFVIVSTFFEREKRAVENSFAAVYAQYVEFSRTLCSTVQNFFSKV